MITKINEFKTTINENNSFINLDTLIKYAKNAGDIVVDAKYALEDLAVYYNDKIPMNRVLQVLTNYDLELEDVEGTFESFNNEDDEDINLDDELKNKLYIGDFE